MSAPAPPSDADAALLADVYAELRRLATSYFRRQPSAHTLQPTALVHEAWLRLAKQSEGTWRGREHFLAVAATAMRQILTDYARRRGAAKRGGDLARVTLSDASSEALGAGQLVDVIALDAALIKLADLNPRHHRLVEMRVFGGLTVAEASTVLGVSPRTLDADWRFVKAWLRREFG